MCITIVFVVAVIFFVCMCAVVVVLFFCSFWISVDSTDVIIVSIFFLRPQIIVWVTAKYQWREKKIHLNAIFIALSCNIGVNLFGGLKSRVYLKSLWALDFQANSSGICRRSIRPCISVCFEQFYIALYLHTSETKHKIRKK